MVSCFSNLCRRNKSPFHNTANSRSANLDFLRASAVLCVYFAHFFELRGVSKIEDFGRFGVVIFFVHTSFVLMQSLQKLEQKATDKAVLVIGFWIRRMFRIYPLAILAVVVVVSFHVPQWPTASYRWGGRGLLLENLLLVPNTSVLLSPMWTLPIEVQMYVLLPLIYLTVKRRWIYLTSILWTCCFGVACLAHHWMPPFTAGGPLLSGIRGHLYLYIFSPCFVAGILSFGLTATRKHGARLPGWVWPLGVALIVASFHILSIISQREGPLLDAPLALAIGVLYANVQEFHWSALEPFFYWIAEYSYGIYLSHIVIFWIALKVMAHDPLLMRGAFLIAASIGVPAILYPALERPLIDLGHRLAGHLTKNHGSIWNKGMKDKYAH